MKTLPLRVGTMGSRLPVMQPGSWRTDKQTSAQRGYGYAWQQARAEHLRAHPLCVMCGKEGRVTAATVVDHCIPHRGDSVLFWNRANWQSLCATHHSGEKQAMERGGGSESSRLDCF